MFSNRLFLCFSSFFWFTILAENGSKGSATQISLESVYVFSPSQLNALYDLYNVTQGKGWDWKTGEGEKWDFNLPDPDPCLPRWQGITCNSKTVCSNSEPCNILQLSLPSYNLRGSIPLSISNLTHLNLLDLDSNIITNTIPSTIGQLINLTILNLSGNQLNGTIPSSLGDNKKLEQILLSSNHLTGSIPESFYTKNQQLNLLNLENNLLKDILSSNISYLIHLQQLNLASNFFLGKIPDSIQSCQQLQQLILTSNFFTGSFPIGVTTLTKLTELEIDNNELIGSIPSSINQLISLETLSISQNKFTSQIPRNAFTMMKNLTSFNINYNHFTGSLPISLLNCSKIQTIKCDYNNFTGKIWENIENMPSLEVLQLISNQLTGSLPSSITKLTKLTTLEVSENLLNGPLPSDIGNLTALNALSLGGNQITGPLPSSIGQLSKLLSLDCSYNQLTGSIPETIGNLALLIEFSCSFNRLNGSLPANLTSLPVIETLDFNHNHISGTIPENFFTSLSTINTIDFSSNRLIGTIPSTFNTRNTIRILKFSQNNLTGIIPNNIGDLHALLECDLSTNQLTGSIPVSIGKANEMITLSLENNFLNGSIPTTIGNLTLINQLDFNNNQLTGIVPDTIQGLHVLGTLILSFNRLFGLIPWSALVMMKKLRTLELEDNLFTGTIPAELFYQLPLLRYLRLSDNVFHGTLPTNITLTGVERVWVVMDFSSNQFHGPLPSQLVNQSSIQIFLSSHNALSQVLPVDLFAVKLLTQVDLSSNYFTQTLPSTVNNMTTMFNFTIGNNYFSGSLDSLFTGSNLLSELYLNSNFFTSTLPSNLSQLLELEVFDLSNNRFVGSIPSSYQNLRKLSTVNFSVNGLTGSIENIFGELNHLETLSLSNNAFIGGITSLINGSNQLFLNSIDISNNQLTGSLPITLFTNVKNLLSFAAIENCFTGSLAESICQATKLTALALDGLHTAESCIRSILPFSKSKSYLVPRTLQGSIPSCFYQMESLQILHLSGNGLTGTLPNDITLTDSLIDLSISHNLLSGQIPNSFQTHSWVNLDLSFNKLTSTLSANISADGYQLLNGSLTLEINRLSGQIPSSLLHIESINILKGNIFACNAVVVEGSEGEEEGIPSHDTSADTYTCGSDSINLTLMSWAGIVMASISIPLLMWALLENYPTFAITIWCRKVDYEVRRWLEVYDLPSSEMKQRTSARKSFFVGPKRPPISLKQRMSTPQSIYFIYDFGLVISGIRALCWYSMLFTIFVLLPLHVLLGLFYGTYQYQYAWILSIAFISGLAPAVLLFLCLFIYLLFTQYYLRFLMDTYYFEQHSKHSSLSRSSAETSATNQGDHSSEQGEKGPSIRPRRSIQLLLQHTFNSLFTFLLLGVLNCVVVLSVQFSYVLALTNGTNNQILTILSLSVSAFIIFWNNVIVIDLFSFIIRHVQKRAKVPSEATTTTATTNPSSLSLAPSVTQPMPSTDTSEPNWNSAMSPLHSFVGDHSFHNQSHPSRSTEKTESHFHLPRVTEYGLLSVFLSNFVPSFASTSPKPKSFLSVEKALFDEERRIFFLTLLLLFNNVLAPIASSAFVNADCFYYLLVTPPAIDTTYNVLLCTKYLNSLLVEGQCFEYATYIQQISFTPPFMYSYQCSSALLTSFADIFLTRYIYIGVVLPIFRLGMKQLQEYYYWNIYDIRSYSSSAVHEKQYSTDEQSQPQQLIQKKEKIDYCFILINFFLYVPLRIIQPRSDVPVPSGSPNEDQSERATDRNVSVTRDEEKGELKPSPAGEKLISTLENQLQEKARYLELLNQQFLYEAKQIINRDYIVLPIISEFTVFITFGAIFPPLAIVVCYTIFVTTYFIQCMIGRVILISRLQPALKKYIPKMNEECRNFRRLFLQSIPSIAILASLFWGFFLFDILGDDEKSVSVSSAIWIMIMMGVSPIIIYCFQKFVYEYFFPPGSPELAADDDEDNAERNGERDEVELAPRNLVVMAKADGVMEVDNGPAPENRLDQL